MTEWQPIETAPKDITAEILVHSEDGYFIASWSAMTDTFYQSSDGQLLGGSNWREPTHWMPLPEPPK